MSIIYFIITLIFYGISIVFFPYFKISLIISSIPTMFLISKNKTIPIVLYIFIGLIYDLVDKSLPFLTTILIAFIILITFLISKNKQLSVIEAIIYSIFVTFSYNFIMFIVAKIAIGHTYDVYHFIKMVLPIFIYISVFIVLICIIFRKGISRKKEHKININ